MAKQRYGINDAYRGTVGTVIGYEWRGRWCLRARPLRVRNPRTARQQANRVLFKQMVQLAGSMKKVLRKGLHAMSMKEHITECNQFVKYNKECFALDGEGKLAVDWESLIISEGSVAVPVFDVPDMKTHPALRAPLPTGGEENRANQPLLTGEEDFGFNLPLPSGGAPQRGGVGKDKDRGGGSPATHAPVRYASTPSNLEGEPVSSDRGSCSPPKLGGVPRRGEGVCPGEGITVEVPFLPHAEGERASGDDEVYLYAYCPEAGEGVLSVSAYRKTGHVSLELPERWQGKTVHLYGFAVDYEGNASVTTYIGMLEPAVDSADNPPANGVNDANYSANSHCAVEKNLWHESCSPKFSSNFALRNFVTKWKQT